MAPKVARNANNYVFEYCVKKLKTVIICYPFPLWGSWAVPSAVTPSYSVRIGYMREPPFRADPYPSDQTWYSAVDKEAGTLHSEMFCNNNDNNIQHGVNGAITLLVTLLRCNFNTF